MSSAGDMGAIDTWKRTWAPLWDVIEPRHQGALFSSQALERLVTPVLVVGAGRGTVVRRLDDGGLLAFGVEPIVELAREGVGAGPGALVTAATCRLPFDDGSFRSVVLPTGSVDLTADRDVVVSVVTEAKRVVTPHGSINIAFYQIPPALEDVLQRSGIMEGSRYHVRRMFALLFDLKNPLACVRQISRWSGRGLVESQTFWAKLRLAMPRDLQAAHRMAALVLERAPEAELDRAALLAAAPRTVPYRRETDVRSLLDDLGVSFYRVARHEDSLLVSFQPEGRRVLKPVQQRVMPDGEWIIRTRGISKWYRGARRKAVDSLDLEIEKATIFGLLGPNGAGKTTTLSMLCGLLEPDQGTVELAPWMSRRELKRIIGYVPQELALYPKLTGSENLAFFGRLYGLSGERLRSRMETLLEMVGLADRAGDKVQTYSTGMQRRLNLALGLVQEPEIILLDEPTVGIDPQSRNCIFEAVLELKKRGTSILYTTHYMEEASRLCDRIAIMDEGRIILEGDPHDAVRKHGLSRMEFQVEGEDPALEDAVASVASVVALSLAGGVLAVNVESSEDAMTVARAVMDAGSRQGVTLSLSSVQEPNLESLFLDLTGKSLRDVT